MTEDSRGTLFPTTCWNLFQAIAEGGTAGANALEAVCSIYWSPIYAYIRSRTPDPERARDLTQGFFEHLLEKNALSRITVEGGRFRSFLLSACKRFLVDDHRYHSRQLRKPAGGWVELELEELETRFASAGSVGESPEYAFDKEWARVVIERSVASVELEYKSKGRSDLFHHLHRYLEDDPASVSHRETAERLGMSEGAVKKEFSRMRERLTAALKAEVSSTLGNPAETEDELGLLLQVLAR